MVINTASQQRNCNKHVQQFHSDNVQQYVQTHCYTVESCSIRSTQSFNHWQTNNSFLHYCSLLWKLSDTHTHTYTHAHTHTHNLQTQKIKPHNKQTKFIYTHTKKKKKNIAAATITLCFWNQDETKVQNKTIAKCQCLHFCHLWKSQR